MNSDKIGIQKLASKITALLIFLVIACAMTVSGCAVTPDTSSQPAATAKPIASPVPSKEANASAQFLTLQDLSVREDQGQTILLVKFSQPTANFRHFPLPNPSRIVLDVFGNTNPSAQAESYRIDTHWLATLRLSYFEGSMRLTSDVAAATIPPYTITPEGGGVRIVIGPVNPSFTAKKDATLVRGGVRADIRAAEATAVSGKTTAAPLGTDKIPGDDKKYTGQKVSLEFKDADIKNVFRLLAEVSGKNLVVTDDVSKKVTIRLIEVPWDQALDLIIETNGLAKEEVGSVMRISTATRLSTEKRQQQEARNASRSAEIPQLSYLTVNYAKAKDLVDKVKLLIKGGADLVPDDRSNFIVVRGSKTDLQEVVEIVTRLDVRTPQVLIESNLIETTPTFSRSLGIEMEALFNQGRIRTSDRFIAGTPFAGGPQPTPTVDQLVIPNTGFRFGYFGNNITGVLSAAEQEGNVKIISRPTVVTLNNEQSTIESVNIIRIVTDAATVGEAGNLREIKAGITLKVTPQVSADGFVLLKIEVKSSTLDFGNQVRGIPAEISREAKANVLVKDGETVVIGGILKDSSSNSDTGIPYLKDIPVLGWLFKRSSWRKDFEELVVFITPRILAAGSENLPTAEQIWRDQMKQTDGAAPLNTSQQSRNPSLP